ncbi:MAG: hypothetical protein GXP05_16775 [Alphaproteobacteria bacterium]|nr:hypothetical protein [Alphaproteobacteria bacterium]
MKQRQNDRTTPDEDTLTSYFQAEKSSRPLPSAHLLEAVSSDAQMAQPAARPLVCRSGKSHGQRHGLWWALGGWQVATALLFCLVVGVSAGFAAPDSLGNVANLIFNDSGFDSGDGSYYSLDDLVVEG